MFKQKKDDLKRLRQILKVCTEEGLGYYVAGAKLRVHLPFRQKLKPVIPISNKKRQAKRLRRTLERLGPTFIKFGQLLSLRPDLVPLEYSIELEKLQDKVPAFSSNTAKKIIEKELKKPIGKLFKKFSMKPIASASIAQVHKATLHSGKVVAVKVQRPDIKEIIDADLHILLILAKKLEQHFPRTRPFRPTDIIKEFSLWTRRELNFQYELSNAQRLKEEMESNKEVIIPKVFPKLSTNKILVMEYVNGIPLDEIKKNKKHLAKIYFISIMQQALIGGLFHADPHPANILVHQNKLVYIDYGIMGFLSKQDRSKVVRFIRTIPDKDPERSMDIIISLARDTSKADIRSYKSEILPILQEAYSNNLKESSFAAAFYKIISLGGKYGVLFDANHVLFAKSIYQAEGLGLQLDPNFNVSTGLQEFGEKYLQMSAKEVVNNVVDSFNFHKKFFLDIPNHIKTIISRLEEKPKAHCEQEHLLDLEKKLETFQKERDVKLIILVLILAGLFLLYTQGINTILGISLGWYVFAGTLLMVFYFVFYYY